VTGGKKKNVHGAAESVKSKTGTPDMAKPDPTTWSKSRCKLKKKEIC